MFRRVGHLLKALVLQTLGLLAWLGCLSVASGEAGVTYRFEDPGGTVHFTNVHSGQPKPRPPVSQPSPS